MIWPIWLRLTIFIAWIVFVFVVTYLVVGAFGIIWAIPCWLGAFVGGTAIGSLLGRHS